MEKLVLNGHEIKYKVISVSHLPKLQAGMDKLYNEGKMNENETFRRYTDRLKFKLPEDFPEAKYIVVLAIEHNNAKVNFHLNGEKHEIIFSFPYHNLQATPDEMTEFVKSKIINQPDIRVEHNRTMFLKHLAARSGLGKYGRNNIHYVDGLGSFHSIYTFFTDFDFDNESNWHEVSKLTECENCTICINKCPTKAISKDEFVIDIEKCIPLYNEIQGEIPEWIDPSAHNSLMGCTICQMYCPANKEAKKKIIQLEDITEEETRMILNGTENEELAESVGRKLRMFPKEHAYYFLPILKRNLELLI